MSDEFSSKPNPDAPNPDGLTDLQRQAAETSTAFQSLAPSAPPPTTDWQRLYEAQAERIKHLENVVATGKLAPITDHPNKDARPPITAAQLQAQWGDMRFLHKSTREEKIAAFGENPASVDDNFLRKCFGRGNSGAEAAELMKSNPLRYRVLREIAKAVSIYAK